MHILDMCGEWKEREGRGKIYSPPGLSVFIYTIKI
jgi:hypothetical protein